MPEVVQIAQEANRRSLIENRRWDGALILGPAVLAPLDNVQISNSAFDALPEALFIEVPEGSSVVGVIGIRNVIFNDCEFRSVGIAGTRASIENFRQGFGGSEGGTIATQDSPPEEGGGSEDASSSESASPSSPPSLCALISS